MSKKKVTIRHRAPAVGVQRHCSAVLRELADTFRRMGDDANNVRLRHLKPRPEQRAADTAIRDTSAAQADAYYNCMRLAERLLPNDQA